MSARHEYKQMCAGDARFTSLSREAAALQQQNEMTLDTPATLQRETRQGALPAPSLVTRLTARRAGTGIAVVIARISSV